MDWVDSNGAVGSLLDAEEVITKADGILGQFNETIG